MATPTYVIRSTTALKCPQKSGGLGLCFINHVHLLPFRKHLIQRDVIGKSQRVCGGFYLRLMLIRGPYGNVNF